MNRSVIQEGYQSFTIRIPASLWQELKRVALGSGKSRNKIVARGIKLAVSRYDSLQRTRRVSELRTCEGHEKGN